MVKVNLKVFNHNSQEKYLYETMGIKKRNEIIYKDGEIITKVLIGDVIKIFRNGEYEMVLNFKLGIDLDGMYKTKYGKINIATHTKEIKIKENGLRIIYDLIIDEHFVDTFTYNLEYSIDR